MVGTPERGVLLCGPETKLGEFHHPAQTEQIAAGKGPEYVVTYGPEWTAEGRRRAVEAARMGLRPWICQKCARRICPICGAPLTVPIASTLLNDDGLVKHLMAVPPRNTCVNPSCRNGAKAKPTPS
ncbi:MAG: hypothetical protein WCI05_14285 [Myxococcales bacterium]